MGGEDDDVAGLKLGSQLRFNPGLEAPGIHRRIDGPRGNHPVASQAGDEGLRDLPPAFRTVLSWNFQLMIPVSGEGGFRGEVEVYGSADRLHSAPY